MTVHVWKLVMTSLDGAVQAREVVVEADNWLAALRFARHRLGEDGGVPAGASCVMSATGEVTILDAAQRRRYELSRVAATERKASVPPNTMAALQAPAKRSTTVAYSPEEAAQIRQQLAVAQQAAQHAAENAVAPSPASPLVAQPASRPDATTTPSQKLEPMMAHPEAALPNPVAPPEAAPAPKKRSVTVAYSPEEAASIRQQLIAANPSAQIDTRPAMAPQDAPAGARPATSQSGAEMPPIASPSMSAGRARSATVAYLPNPVAGESLLPVSSRDQDPSPESPLHYRERCYFTPRTLDSARLEALLLAELSAVQESLKHVPRGKFVNMAVFDHYFQGKPERPPIATLQWKDWRGAPVFALRDAQPLPSWRPPQGPVRSVSFAPAPLSVPPTAYGGAAFPPAPRESAAPPAPATAAPRAPAADVAPGSQPAAWPPVAVPPAAAQPVGAPVVVPPMGAAPAVPPTAAQPVGAPVAAAPVALPAAFDAPSSSAMPISPPVSEVRDPTGDQDRRLAVAFEATQDLYFLGTPAEALGFAVKLLGELVPSEAASGCLYDINTDEFRFVALTGPGAAERQAEAVPSNAGLLGTAAHGHREQYVAPDVQSEERYDPAVDGRVGLDARNMAYFPVQKNDLMLGMLQLINRRGSRGFSEADGAVATYVAGQVAEFLSARRGISRRR